MRKQQVVIIGGGTVGLAAAVSAARCGTQVTIMEHMDRAGKKILSTDSGRRNMTNLYMEPECYRSNDKSFSIKVIQGFPVEETLGFFRGLGIEPKDRNGYIYPNSNQTSAVLDVLHQEVDRLGICMLLSCEVGGIESAGHTYRVNTSQGVLEADASILITGSKAAPATDSDGNGYELAKKLGHSVVRPLSALVQLRCQGTMYRQMASIRTEAKISLFSDGKLLAEGRGELQLTDYGLSGIPIFQISRFASRTLDQGKRVIVKVDFTPSWKDGDALGLLKKRAAHVEYKTVEEMFTGLLNKRLALVPIRLAGIDPCRKADGLSPGQLKHLVQQLKPYEAIIMSVNPFANVQICCGGVGVKEVNALTMESRIRKNLYLAGGLLDMDDICGGYNLQFTWSSGVIAGRNAFNTNGRNRTRPA